jgi:serine/threonine-protein kinase HipA
MSKNNIISVNCFGKEIGILGLDEQKNKSFFQYNPQYLDSGQFKHLFPVKSILKRTEHTQVFGSYNNECFRGLPPVFADSLPDAFGNIIFRKWFESMDKEFRKISILEQLAYVGKRGIGALEYLPAKELPLGNSIELEEILSILEKVLSNKENLTAEQLNHESLLNIFKIGSSAGGARPKILISEHKQSGQIIPGDLVFTDDYHHYLVKLSLDEPGFNREQIEYCYYLTALELGINMMPSKLIDNRHFATLRFDRVGGKKKHILSASGISGWNFNDPDVSSYENLFELSVYLKLPQKDIDELYRRMIFNLIFSNRDDHLKNHSFIYDELNDCWNLSPAYDLTYSLNPLLNYNKINRALAINAKRTDIQIPDLIKIAENYTVKNPLGIIRDCKELIPFWLEKAKETAVPIIVANNILNDFTKLN